MANIEVLRKRNLTISQDRSKLMQIDKEIAGYLNKDEVHKLLSVISNKRDYLLLDFLWKTGCRISEALAVSKGNIDFYNKTVKIRWLKRRKAKERYIPLHDSLAYELSVFTGPLNLADTLFPISRQRAFQIIKKYSEKAELGKEVHPHTLRHSFAIHFLSQTGNLVMLKELMGHAQITTTMMYLQYVKKDLKEAINGIEF